MWTQADATKFFGRIDKRLLIYAPKAGPPPPLGRVPGEDNVPAAMSADRGRGAG